MNAILGSNNIPASKHILKVIDCIEHCRDTSFPCLEISSGMVKVKDIIQAHLGYVNKENFPEKGICFRVFSVVRGVDGRLGLMVNYIIYSSPLIEPEFFVMKSYDQRQRIDELNPVIHTGGKRKFFEIVMNTSAIGDIVTKVSYVANIDHNGSNEYKLMSMGIGKSYIDIFLSYVRKSSDLTIRDQNFS